ncbi:PTS sugar transporter subunit IIC [Romboutsia sp.]|uniref:PTS transporter subunit IIC n=1 Tax=Romboutsia sp. TaxID=1965302 RepID=UPI002B7D3854|nr:PTS sugar transporter subunit IIC [Romboutsia sp.]HSQ90139.1 PTS sugar transporter subunit IIC [Romboutsia sp.]
MKQYFIKTLNGMGLGLFASLVIGTILQQIGIVTNIELLQTIGIMAKNMMGAAIGVGVAYSLGAPSLVIFSCVVVGMIGAGSISIVDKVSTLSIGDPVGAYIASLIGVEVGKRIHVNGGLDIITVPSVTIVIGGLVGIFVSPIISGMIGIIGQAINRATELQPLYMGPIVAVIVGLVLVSPISSAALAIGLGLDGIAAGAAVAGCACQMVGFGVISYKENGFSGLISQGLGTAKIQFPNVVKNPRILIPTTIASIIVGALSARVFAIRSNSTGAGMGTSGLVGQIQAIDVMGTNALLPILLLHFILPALISIIISEYMRKKGYIKLNDMKLYKID